MNIETVVVLGLILWTLFGGIRIYLFFRLVRHLENQPLSGTGGANNGYKHPYIVEGVQRNTAAMSKEEMESISASIDTQEAHKSAMRQENVSIVGGENLCKEEIID